MPGTLPPAPINEPPGSFAWQQWYSELTALYSQAGVIPWAAIDTTGSNITDIASRAHNNLQTIQGGTTGEYYHTTLEQNDAVSLFRGGTGAPSNGDGNDGDFYFRSDGTKAGNTVPSKPPGGLSKLNCPS